MDGVRRWGLVAVAIVATGAVLFVDASAGAVPAASAAVGGANQPAPGATPTHKLHRRQTVVLGSKNWAGYAEVASTNTESGPFRAMTYTAVEDSWTVPTVTVKGTAFSSDWVGIGGYAPGDSTLVQAGTEADSVDQEAQYRAWTEVLPAAEDPLSMTVRAGDRITVVVREIAVKEWTMAVTDVTRGVTQSRTVFYGASGSSAEAIHERPTLGSHLAKLAVTTPATFTPGFYSESAPGSSPVWRPLLDPAPATSLADLVMVKTRRKVLATPSRPSADGKGFTVADGATAPGPPAS